MFSFGKKRNQVTLIIDPIGLQDVLKVRGFPWPEAAKKKKKGKKK